MIYLRYLILGLLLGACAPIIPATTPPQFQHTPGTFVIVTDNTFDAGVFRVNYPPSWRVVKTSIASTDLVQVVFVAPDKSSITLTQTDIIGESISDDERFVTLENDIIIQVITTPSEDVGNTFNDLANQLIDSIRSDSE